MTSTVYDVKVRYALDDKASKGFGGIAAAADKATSKAVSLKGALAAIGGMGALLAGKKLLIDFNSEMDQMKIGMTTILNMQLKKPWQDARKEADGMFKTFQEMAKKSPATTKDFMTMAAAITPVIASMGGGVDKITKLTQGAVIAGLATGTRADVAALDIKQMLAGTVSARDMMAQQLISAKGMQYLDFNKLDAGKRGQLVEEMLSHSALQKAADDFGNSFQGQISTLKDQLEITFGQVGLPLMGAMSEEVKRWNTWIEKHPKTISRIVSSLGGFMKDSFSFIKQTAGWLVEHSDTILSIGKIFLTFKGAQLATNVFGNFATGITGLVTQMRTAGTTLMGVFTGAGSGGLLGSFGSLVGILSGAGGVIPVFAALIPAVGAFLDALNPNKDLIRKARTNVRSYDEALGTAPDQLRRFRELNAQSKDPSFMKMDPDIRARLETEKSTLQNTLFKDPKFYGEFLTRLNDAQKEIGGTPISNLSMGDLMRKDNFWMQETFDMTKLSKEVVTDMNMMMEQFSRLPEAFREQSLKTAFPDQFGRPDFESKAPTDFSTWAGKPEKSDVKVTIHKIEVASEDPDRFVFGLAQLVDKAIKNPTQATSTVPGGF